MTTYVSSVVPADISDISGIVLENVPCDATVYVGAAVRMNASGVAFNALADGVANSNVIGIVQSKSGSELCDIRVTGVSPEIMIGLDVTKEYYLSSTVAGGLTTIPPTTGGTVRLKLGQPFSATRFLVIKGERVIRN